MTSTTAISFAVAGRFLLSFSNAYETLKDNHLLSSPLTSFSRLQEGIYLNQHGIDPYSGGLFYQSPLLLALFSTVIPLNAFTARILWAGCDELSAYFLLQIWRLRSKTTGGNRESMLVGAFLLNPYLFLSSLALSTSTIENTLFLASVYYACTKKRAPCLLTVALLAHLALPNVLLMPPIVLLLMSQPESLLASPRPFKGDLGKGLRLVGEFAAYFVALFVISSVASDGFAWVARTWGAGFLLPDLTPNPGLWWYFLTEMFDHFRPYFLMVFSVHLFIYVAPVCLKFQHDYLYATFILQGILAIFKPYPTMADSGLFLSMLSLFPEIYDHLRHAIVTALLHLHASLLLPLFHSLWLEQGTGNANFFYASTLVFGLANGAAVVDSIYAGLRIAVPSQKGYETIQE